MIDNSAIYSNPVIPPRHYCAKLVNLKQEPSEYIYPKILAWFLIHPDHDLGEIILKSIIHPTPSAKPVYDMFSHTFLKDSDEELEQAVGRCGALQVFCKNYEGTDYSMVKFVEQTSDLLRQMEEVFGVGW